MKTISNNLFAQVKDDKLFIVRTGSNALDTVIRLNMIEAHALFDFWCDNRPKPTIEELDIILKTD